MLKQIGRPSPALVISLIALFAALGGTVYAASKINGRTIKVKSIPGNRLKSNSVTGKQVKESTLGLVRRAREAQSAGTAVSSLDAVNAEKIMNRTVDCPNGTQIFLSACWENSPRPAATVAEASKTCGSAGGTLPGPFELVSFASHSPLTSSTDEWTDQINTVSGPNNYTMVTVSKAGVINETASSDTKEYRCVIPMLRLGS